MMDENKCLICNEEIWWLDRELGKIYNLPEGEVHSWCQVIEYGVIPECPIISVTSPSSSTNLCVQAYNEGWGICENMNCQTGKSVRHLRNDGKIDWNGYMPDKIRHEEFEKCADLAMSRFDVSTYQSAVNRIIWTDVLSFLRDLSSHGTYTPLFISKEIKSAMIDVDVFPCNIGLAILGMPLQSIRPDTGSYGIWSLDLGYLLYKILTGADINSELIGKGYRYREMLENFEAAIIKLPRN